MITGSLLEDHFRVNPDIGEVLYQTRWGNWLPAGNIPEAAYAAACEAAKEFHGPYFNPG